MKIKKEFNAQISESLLLAFFLSLSGGFQDAYSYHCRGKVFANAQTGNIVLMGSYLVNGEFLKALHYFLPVLAFILGIYLTECIRFFFKENDKFHWRQLIIFFQIIIMLTAGLMPKSMDMFANILLSFSCAAQISCFKKFRGLAFATTMCIGNMKNGVEHLAKYYTTKDKESKYKSSYYFGAIIVFAIGASLGFIFSNIFYLKSIWIAGIFLLVGFILMMIKEKNNDRTIKKTNTNIGFIPDILQEISELKNIFIR